MTDPADLDAHLWLPTTQMVHIYKGNKGSTANPAIRAALDVENANGFGPEVVTLSGFFSGEYTFGVYMNSDPDDFVNSGGRVYVYEGSTLKATVVIPDTGVGHWWKVFTLNFKRYEGGDITKPVYDLKINNLITDQEPSPAAYK